VFLGDFGCSVLKQERRSSQVGRICSGTLGFVAPEIILSNCYDEKCDLFSLGSLFYFLLTGEPIFSQKLAQEIYEVGDLGKLIEEKVGQIRSVGDNAKSLLRKLLEVSAEERVSAQEALRHEYFANMELSVHVMGEDNLTLATYLQDRVQKMFN
jgi:serine/threonine protein kinase